MERDDIESRFNYHPADTQARQVTHKAIRDGCRDLAIALNFLLDDGREKSVAITKLEECMFWANAGVARYGPPAPRTTHR